MTKTQFIEKFWKSTNLKYKTEAERLVNIFLDTVKECVADGEKVEFMGFGSFLAVDKPEMKGRNPRTNEEIIIPAKKVVKFKVGKDFKEIVNKKR